MRLLITTQAVDLSDPILGFFHRWIEEFSKHCDEVHVICLRRGETQLPANVHVHSLGKESGRGRVARTFTFLKLVWTLRNKHDAVFAHMNPEYVVLAGWFWRLRSKPVVLWYVHKSVTWWLKVAVWFATVVCTAVRNSISIQSPKIRVLGHGIDIAAMQGIPASLDATLVMKTVGRISKSKGIDTILDMCDLLARENEPFALAVIGAPATDEERVFATAMERRAAAAPFAARVQFKGPIRNTQVPEALIGTNFFLNISNTGGLDKSVLEAALLGIPVLSTNPTFRELLEPHGLFFETADPAILVGMISAFRKKSENEQQRIVRDVAAQVRSAHALDRLILAILKELRA